ncbi:MAG: valine--tRNA ligase [Erysipelotrichaceae bacterium]|nr:valine--tRNA ligase [Erysipelotrichaceae bacterium]
MLEKIYDAKKVEEGKYEFWKSRDYFKSGDLSKEPYCIVIPPPNVTGKLHLGHAWDTAIQDIIVRYKRMCGYDVLWLPGMDHAAIATEVKVINRLKEQGIDKYELGREKFLEECFKWKEEHEEIIHSQWAKLGLSVDYDKERFTMDEGMSKAVRRVFVDLYNKGLIYRGEKIINWDPKSMTALSNEEVIYKDVPAAFYHIKYYLEDKSEYLEVATTRPETLFGDVAVAVHPDDERYKNLIGKKVILPIVNKLIPIIADEHADPEFGTGVVKITPAHDPNDFEVGNRHNLERIKIMNPDGTMNEKCGEFAGMDRFVCREKVVEYLQKQDLLIDIKKMTHSVGHSERTDVMVEPYLSRQWFVKMRPLADQVLATQQDKNKKVNFVPTRYEKIMNHWMEITYDWCISRQLWWGHQIPAWYKGEEVYVGMEPPKEEGWVQDSDVLDTWFSSALWPFATLGWPEQTANLSRYYPNNVLVTGYDIIPFWVNRMTFQGLEFMGKRPFKDCLIHGLIRDKEGRKMSKSLGNGVDPMDVIEEYGADALRFFLTTNTASGMDLRYDEEKVKSTWNFINKLWNASRYVLMNTEDLQELSFENLSNPDKWILTKLNKAIKEVTKSMEKYDFNIVGNTLYSFIWNDFCDKYIELSKFKMNLTTKSVLIKVLDSILKMLHPFMPYVTEEIYQMLPVKNPESIMISNYPTYDKEMIFLDEEKTMDQVLEFITMFRTKKQELNIGNDFHVTISISDESTKEIIMNSLKLTDKVIEKPLENNTLEKIKLDNLEINIIYDNSKNELEIRKNLEKERDNLIQSINRREKLLGNENYVKKAPSHIVSNERDTLQKEKEQLELIISKLK